MQVIKRNGNHVSVSFDKITKRISDLCYDLSNVDPISVAKETINGIYDRIKTSELDILSADICATKSQHHPEYNLLGGRILASNIIKNTSDQYIDVVQSLFDQEIVSQKFYNFVVSNHPELQDMIDYKRDLLFDYFAIKTLERSYLFKINSKIVERPQHMWMRVAIQVHAFLDQENVLELIKETYDLLSTLYFTHATPTLFNSGTDKPQLSSCYLFSAEDNLEDIFGMISNVAKISKWAGGIGLSLSNIRSKGSLIKGTNGKSEGIIPLCKTLEMVGRYINQGGKRQGSIAVYLEPWCADIYEFIELRKNTGDENLRARDLFTGLWIPDLFMKRVRDDQDWTLMCPHECEGLVDSYGEEFETLYISYEEARKGKKTIKARDLWNHILESQIETGMPYLSFKDTVNRKNMQKQLGVIRNSNLCVSPETMVLTSDGYFEIKSLENKKVNVWNGEEFTETTVIKTGENQELIKVVLSNGSYLECTPYHHFYIKKEKVEMVEAKDLLKNDELIEMNLPIIDGKALYQTKKIPPVNSDIKHKIKWLNYIFKTNGYVNNFGIQISSDFKTLISIKYFLQTLGCDCLIEELNENFYTLIISQKEIEHLITLGFNSDLLTVFPLNTLKSLKMSITVEKVIHTKRVSDTYCFKELKRGMGVFNGILTGQCNEIALVSNKDNIAVCNLASICLPRFIENSSFNFEKLRYVSGVITRNLNNVIDVNFYPVSETQKTNFENRPIGIGIQGLADVYCTLGLPFGSIQARALNRQIFETIYYGAIEMSISLAKQYGPYQSFQNSPHSNGLFQFDLCDQKEFMMDWEILKTDMKKYGIRNSLLTACMPTASTSQIMGNNECFEPFTSNIYLRKTLAGEFTVVNQHLIRDLIKLDLWNKKVYEEILYDNGSVQKIKEIPTHIKEIYKTAFELKMTDLLNQAVERSPFIDHMQSMNLFMAKPQFNLLNSSHFFSWKNGLKTGMYYLRTLPITDAIKFGLDPSSVNKIKEERKQILRDAGVVDGVCPRNEYLKSICDSCSS
jgi:ribonucleotide reductase alpha subunit